MLKKKFDVVPWTIWQTFNGILWTLVPYIAFLLLVSFSSQQTTNQAKSAPVSLQLDLVWAVSALLYSVVAEGVFLIAPIYFAKRNSSGNVRSILQALGFRRFNVWRVLPMIIALFGSFFLVNYLYEFVITTFHLPLQTNNQLVFERGKVAPISIYATLLGAVVIAPPCEEIFFRSFTFMGLLHKMPVWLAIILSAFLFALVHVDLASFAVLFFIGLALAFLRWYSNSIWPGIILHALNNATSGVIIILALHNIIKM